jgi:hypothetical protein
MDAEGCEARGGPTGALPGLLIVDPCYADRKPDGHRVFSSVRSEYRFGISPWPLMGSGYFASWPASRGGSNSYRLYFCAFFPSQDAGGTAAGHMPMAIA